MNSILKRVVRQTRRRLRYLQGQEPKVRVISKYQTQYLGSDNGGWAVIPSLLSRDSVIYSFGVGEDISFDLAMIEKFGVKVHAFDPTPRSIEWVKSRNVPERFSLHEYGLSDQSGTIKFRKPKNSIHISHSAVDIQPADKEVIELPVRSLNEIAGDLEHTRIDVLKMDIEGSEYCVLEKIADWAPTVVVVLAEFHHRFPTISVDKTRQAIASLSEAGFEPFWMSDTGEEIGFVNANRLTQN